MIRKRLGQLAVRAYPRAKRKAFGAEIVDTLLERQGSRREFVRDCASLVAGGISQRDRRDARLALAGVASVAALGGTVAAVSTGGTAPGPTASAHAPIAWLRANQHAVDVTFRHGGTCRINPARRGGSIQLLQGQPTADLSSLFAVLRRPAPRSQRVSTATLRHLDVDVGGVYVRYARRGVTDGITYYMLPGTSVGGAQVPARCYSQQLAVFEHQVAGLSSQQRTTAVAWERNLIDRNEGPRDGVVLVTAGGGGTGASYLTVARLRIDPWDDGGGGGSNHITKTALLVPDSVASVTARYGAQTYPGRVAHPIDVTRRVKDNLAVFIFRGAWDPPSLTYRSAAGSILSSTIHG